MLFTIYEVNHEFWVEPSFHHDLQRLHNHAQNVQDAQEAKCKQLFFPSTSSSQVMVFYQSDQLISIKALEIIYDN